MILPANCWMVFINSRLAVNSFAVPQSVAVNCPSTLDFCNLHHLIFVVTNNDDWKRTKDFLFKYFIVLEWKSVGYNKEGLTCKKLSSEWSVVKTDTCSCCWASCCFSDNYWQSLHLPCICVGTKSLKASFKYPGNHSMKGCFLNIIPGLVQNCPMLNVMEPASDLFTDGPSAAFFQPVQKPD